MSTRFICGFVFAVVLMTGVAQAGLPQDHDYQVVLREHIASLTEADFEVALQPFEWNEDWIEDEQHLHRVWLLRGANAVGYPAIVRALPGRYTLSEIESADGIRMGTHFAKPDEGAWLATWDWPGNPYYGDRGLMNRAFVSAAVEMMMLDAGHEAGQRRRSDYLGGAIIPLSYFYDKLNEKFPEELMEAYETGLARFVGRLHQWGPRRSNDNIDLKSVVAMRYIAQSARDPELRQQAEDYARRVLVCVHNSGMVYDAGGLDASYHGIAKFFLAWAACAAPDWDFLQETFERMSDLKAYLTLPHLGGYISPTHFSVRTSAGIDADQWSRYQRDIAAAMTSDHALYLAFGGRGGRGSGYAIRDVDTMRAQAQANLTRTPPDPNDAVPGVWGGHRHWQVSRIIDYASNYYHDGFYDRLRTVLDEQSSEMLPPWERPGETFVRNFADTFLVARFEDFGVILYTGPLGWHRYMNYAGGSLSAFWTAEMGAVLLGHAAGNHQRAPWPEWRSWPTHALSGVTADGKAFSSARVRRRVMDVSYELDRDRAEVRVAGPIGAGHDGGRAVQDGAIAGKARYERQFSVSPRGLEIETSWSSDGADEIAELYESIPVYLQDARRGQSPAIMFRSGGEWTEAGAEPAADVDAVRVARGEHSIIIALDRAREVRLAPKMFQDDYMTRNQLRNVQISLIEPGRAPAPLETASVSFTIRRVEAE